MADAKRNSASGSSGPSAAPAPAPTTSTQPAPAAVNTQPTAAAVSAGPTAAATAAASPAAPTVEQKLQQLQDLGFDRANASRALTAASGDVDTAASILFAESGF